MPSRPLVYAHRGGSALRPENTIMAFDHGLSLGADGLELDVHLSRDGVVVIHHDPTLERTTSGRGRLCELTTDELARLDAGHGFTDAEGRNPFRGRGCTIPMLRDVLRRYPDIPLIVELKVNEPPLAHKVIDELRAAHALERTALGSFYWRVLHAARAYEPAIRTGAATEETRWALYRSWVRWPLGRPAYAEFQVPERSGVNTIVTPRFIAHAHRSGLPVKVWTVDDPDDMRRLLSWGVDALITDRPDLAVPIATAHAQRA
jgi:glycerophosphoryl diester phosphodiesterase